MKRVFFQLFLFISISSAGANSSNYLFRNLSTDNGLICAQVHAILEDNNGFLWVGTTDGLNRYDGFTFKNHIPDIADTNSIQAYNISN